MRQGRVGLRHSRDSMSTFPQRRYFCTCLPDLPPWRGKVGMGGEGLACRVGCDRASPPPLPSPIKGEGKKTSVQTLSAADESHHVCAGHQGQL